MQHEFYYVIFRTGGTSNFQWHRSLKMLKEQAETTLKSVTGMGYRAMIEKVELSDSIGLPDTYDILTGSRKND